MPHRVSTPPATPNTSERQDGQRPPRLDDVAAGDEELAFSGRHDVELELDSEDGIVLSHQGERGITAGVVGQGPDHPAVEIVVLLG